MNRLAIKKEEVICISDGGNDIELIKAVGWPIAMGNGCNELKPYVKLITKSNSEDGVADTINKLFLKEDLTN